MKKKPTTSADGAVMMSVIHDCVRVWWPLSKSMPQPGSRVSIANPAIECRGIEVVHLAITIATEGPYSERTTYPLVRGSRRQVAILVLPLRKFIGMSKWERTSLILLPTPIQTNRVKNEDRETFLLTFGTPQPAKDRRADDNHEDVSPSESLDEDELSDLRDARVVINDAIRHHHRDLRLSIDGDGLLVIQRIVTTAETI